MTYSDVSWYFMNFEATHLLCKEVYEKNTRIKHFWNKNYSLELISTASIYICNMFMCRHHFYRAHGKLCILIDPNLSTVYIHNIASKNKLAASHNFLLRNKQNRECVWQNLHLNELVVYTQWVCYTQNDWQSQKWCKKRTTEFKTNELLCTWTNSRFLTHMKINQTQRNTIIIHRFSLHQHWYDCASIKMISYRFSR